MPRGARTIADLDRAIRSLQRRAREHAAVLRAIELRLDAEDGELLQLFVPPPKAP